MSRYFGIQVELFPLEIEAFMSRGAAHSADFPGLASA